jgi:hypothetical protein
MEMARIWPILVEFGVGAVLCMLGIWCGIASGYLELKDARDRRLLILFVGGFAGLLLFYLAFTFWLPFVTHHPVLP